MFGEIQIGDWLGLSLEKVVLLLDAELGGTDTSGALKFVDVIALLVVVFRLVDLQQLIYQRHVFLMGLLNHPARQITTNINMRLRRLRLFLHKFRRSRGVDRVAVRALIIMLHFAGLAFVCFVLDVRFVLDVFLGVLHVDDLGAVEMVVLVLAVLPFVVVVVQGHQLLAVVLVVIARQSQLQQPLQVHILLTVRRVLTLLRYLEWSL